MSDDHSRIARLEEAVKSVCHSLDEMKSDAKERGDKLDRMIAQIAVAIATVEKIKELETRLRAVESWRWYSLGAFAVIVYVLDLFTKS